MRTPFFSKSSSIECPRQEAPVAQPSALSIGIAMDESAVMRGLNTRPAHPSGNKTWMAATSAAMTPSGQPGAVDRRSAQVYGGDPPRVGDVVERIGVEHDEVGALAGLQRARIVEPQELGR